LIPQTNLGACIIKELTVKIRFDDVQLF